MKKVYIETLGCPRNQVDSQTSAGLIMEKGYEITTSPEEARFIIVNTCGFIEDAINQSLDFIFSLLEFKKTGKCEFFIVAGCMAERFQDELAKELPEVDYFVGTGAYFNIPHMLEDLEKKSDVSKNYFPDPKQSVLLTSKTPQFNTTFPYAYLKIAEGCARHCTYCIIPKLRGPLKSRPWQDIVEEAEILVQKGVKEIVLVSQETTDYARDLKDGTSFAFLLDKLAGVSKDVWIRFMYGHPLSITDELLDVVAENDNICSYFDIPVQHASDSVLKRMGRNYDLEFLRSLFKKIRSKVKGAVLRTTLITGFPGESDSDFQILSDFMEEAAFDHAGVFTYSEMDDLPSAKLGDKVDAETAEKRRVLLMEKQALVSQNINYDYCGKTLPVIIDRKDSKDFYCGRTMFQAPDVDGVTYVDAKDLKPGDIVNVYITDSFDYDLAGNV